MKAVINQPSFILLGIFPLITKKLVNLYRRKTGMGAVDPDGKS